MGTHQPEDSHRILDAIRNLADPATGRPPTKFKVFSALGLSQYQFNLAFHSYEDAVRAAGLTPYRQNMKLPLETQLKAYGCAILEAGRRPTRTIYTHVGKHSAEALSRACGSWDAASDVFRHFAADKPEWQEALAILDRDEPRVQTIRRLRDNRAAQPVGRIAACALPVCGAPLNLPAMRQAPVNELGVVALFGMLAERLGYAIHTLREAFPDCQAQREVAPGNWRQVRIEFEFESRNFQKHGHDVDGCDMIVCWRHNWPECPANLEVLELGQMV